MFGCYSDVVLHPLNKTYIRSSPAALIQLAITDTLASRSLMLIRSATTAFFVKAQTAECLVVGEIATERLVVVLNKVDMLPAVQRDKLVIKAQKMLRKTFVHTKFRDPPMVAVSAKPGRHATLA